ncbi:uncharacterized protein LOC114974577 [Acropora millepora]|uniref:uncharacterized protein LOC114974577 n=1 Tax=Acropora millepora TaxID=45264 RepID=UPI001CF49B41|nr:uncharacterized protein LOC114974577 [Acropora millepora]
MWTSSWRDFNHEYYKYRKTFKEVLREERVLDEERRRQAMHTAKLNRLQKQLEQTKRKGDTGRCSSMANEILEVVSQAEKLQAELEVKASKLEMVKAEKLRESMLQISDGLNQWASKTLLVAEAYSKLANLIPDAQTQLSESKIFHGTSESRNIVNNLARDLIIDTELSQQLKDMSHSAQSSLYAVSTPILPTQQNGVKCNHVGLDSEKMPGKVNRKPVGQNGTSPQALCHHHLGTKKMDPNFGRPLSVPDLRPPPISPPPPLPKEAPAQTTSKMLPEHNNNIQWYASANISSDSDSDWEEGYAQPYSDPRLAQRKMLWKAASDGVINTIGRVYEEKDTAMSQRTERQSEEDLSNDNDSAAYVDFTDDVERMMQPRMRLLQDNKSGVSVDLIDDGGEPALYVDLINDTETMTMLSEEVLLKVNESAT